MTDTRQPPRPDTRPQGATPAGQGGNGGPEDDPLFELARIVADSIRSDREAEAGRAGQSAPEPVVRAFEPPPISGGVFGFDAEAFESELLRSAEEQVAPSRPLRSRATPLAPRSAEPAPRIEPPMTPPVAPAPVVAPAVAPPVAHEPAVYEEPLREEDEVFLDHDEPAIEAPRIEPSRDVAPPRFTQDRFAQDRFTQDFEAALFGDEPAPRPPAAHAPANHAPEPAAYEPLDEPDPYGEPPFEYDAEPAEASNEFVDEVDGRAAEDVEPEGDYADAESETVEEAEPFSPAAVEEAPSPQKRGAFTFDPDLEQALGGELRAALGPKAPEIKADRERDVRGGEVRPPATDESTLILGARPMRGPAAKLNTLSQQEPAVARQDQAQFEPIPPLEKAPLRPGASPVKPTVIDTPPVPPIDDPKPAASEERREPDFDFGSLDLDLDHGPDPAAIGATRPIEPVKRPEPEETDVEANAAAAGSLSWLRSERDPAGDGLDGDLGEDAEDSFGRPPQARGARRGQKRGIWILATVVVVAVAGIGAYQVLGLVGGNSAGGPPPEIKADSSPVKEAPPSTDQQNASTDDPSKVFYDRVANTNDPAKQNLNTAAAPGESAQGAGAAAGASKTDLPGVNVGDAPTSADSDGQAMVPRKVRTVVVRPDGTIVTPDPSQVAEAAAQNAGSAPSSDPFGGGGEASPLSPPSSGQPAAAGADQGGNAAAAPADDDFYPAPPRKPVRAGQAAPAPAQPAPQAAEAAPAANSGGNMFDAAQATVGGAAPPPAPADQAAAPAAPAAEAPAPTPAAAPAAAPAASEPQSLAAAAGGAAPAAAQPAAAAASPGGYGIQVASQKTEADAQKVYAGLQRRFASVLAGRPAVIRQVDLGAKGVYYRVKVPAGSSAEAASLCNALKAAGGDCYVSKL